MNIDGLEKIPQEELGPVDDDAKEVLATGQVPSDVLESIKLDEYSGESNYEPYSGIVLDPEENTFKTVSGMFRDKKEFYEKLTARGYVVRKVFEKKVFDWIEENAKTTLEAYLMLSTAFSKWKGNNLLNEYYTKLLNDIPQLNREKIKGNPNTRGLDNINTEESVLTEDDDKYYSLYNIKVTPLDAEGNIIGQPLEFRKQPLHFIGNLLPRTDVKNSVKLFLADNLFFVNALYDEINAPKTDEEGNIIYDKDGYTINGAKENPQFANKDIKKLKVDVENKCSFLTSPTQIIGIKALRKPIIKSDTRQSERDATLASKDFVNTKNLKMFNLGNFDALQDIADTKNNSGKVQAMSSNKSEKNLLQRAALIGNPIAIKLQNEIKNLEADLQKLDFYPASTPEHQSILSRYNAQHKTECNQLIKQRIEDIYTEFKQANINNKIPNTIATDLQNDIKSKLAQQGVKTGGYRSKYTNESTEDEPIPVVDDIIPSKRVNYNATLSYANMPVDGVVTNPGAIPTSGQYMYEQDEHWGWVHDELNQDLFNGTKLKPEVREALLRIAEKFKNTLGLSIEPVDVYFTGSSANFNYNDSSDIDLHLVYDFEKVGINAEILVKYFIAKKQVFNNDYEISIKGIPVELGVENLNEPIVSSAIYSLTKDSWLLEPEYAEQLLPQPDMKQYYDIVQKIEKAIETRDSKEIGRVWDELYDIRRDSLAREGEYGKGNALFKKLRNLGYLDRLKNAYYSSASEELSLESLKEII